MEEGQHEAQGEEGFRWEASYVRTWEDALDQKPETTKEIEERVWKQTHDRMGDVLQGVRKGMIR